MRPLQFVIRVLTMMSWCVLASGISGCSNAQSNTEVSFEGVPANLVVVPVARGSIIDIIPAVGRIRPATQVEVGAQVSGRIVSIDVEFDAPVTTGQILARIDPAPFVASLNRAQAGYRSAVASRDEVQAQLALATRELTRAQELSARGNISQSSVENLEFELQRLAATFDRADANISLASGAVEEARIAMSHTEILSPIDGFVLDRKIEIGQIVNATLSTPVLFVVAANLEQVIVEADIAEADVSRIVSGMSVRIRVDAYPRTIFTGIAGPVRRAATIENRFVTYPVSIQASDPEQRLLPGMTASVEFIAAEAYGALIVPRKAFTVGYPSGFQPPAEVAAAIREYYNLSDDEPILPNYQGAVIGSIFGNAISRNMRAIFVWANDRIEVRQVRAGAEDFENFSVVDGDLVLGDLVIVESLEPDLEL